MVGGIGDVLLEVRNHSPPDGMPPRIDPAHVDRCFGYFENAFGEQALFVFDRTMRTATLYLGDAGWRAGTR